MSSPAATPLPSTVETEGERAYLGYRRGCAATLRLPSGAYVSVPRRGDDALSEALLADRLGRKPNSALVERFSREWVGERAEGEFVWPLVAIDEWLASLAVDGAGSLGTRRHTTPSLSRLQGLTRHLLSGPHARFGPTLSPRGGH